MATATHDYARFLRWLHALQPAAPQNVRQFANMVHGDFDAIIDTAPQRNARSAHLAALARRSLAATGDGMPEGGEDEQGTNWPWTRLHSLAIGPFRGFVRAEVFDLQRRVVLFYGPNGAGKSSICEAIERALLGSVEEAGLKRLDDAAYLRNIHVGRFVEPRLTATGADRREAAVRANPDLYRFCFIEKNRIDAFSRIAQRPQAQRAELIATLFGMDKFNDFCNRFNEQIDPCLAIDARKLRELRGKQEVLARDRATAETEGEKLARHDAEDEAYAVAFRPDTTFARLQEIIGTAETPGRLAELNGMLDGVPGTLVGLDRATLTATFERADRALEALATTVSELQRRASQVSYRKLYGAVVALEAESADRCPACETPLESVARDPFAKARAGLAELRELAELQERQERERAEIAAASTELLAQLTGLSRFVSNQGGAGTSLGRYLGAMPVRPETDGWWTGVYQADAGEEGRPASLVQLLAACDRVTAADEATRQQLEQRNALAAERENLIARQRHVDQRRQARQRIVEDAAMARANIEAFDAANAGLVEEVETERLAILRDAPIRAAYDAYLPYLRRFRDELPGMLIAGLGDVARDLYNDFNRGDRDEDKLASLYLPLTGEQRIQLAFRGTPERRVDALQVLSEGHIRCLGLAILLAKATSIDSPLLIFDDAVNAIDHDHRNGIKETIFASDRFMDTQILVTCHSPEFIKDARNAIPQPRRGDCQEYALTHHEGDHHPRVRREVASSAYIDKARTDLDRFQLRDALGNSRRALELLSNKAWRWLASHELGEIRLTMHGPGSPLILRDLCDAIRIKLRDSLRFDHPSRELLLTAISEILNASNLTWTYLNGGTHEQEGRDEFDRAEVELVVTRLERIDALELRMGR